MSRIARHILLMLTLVIAQNLALLPVGADAVTVSTVEQKEVPPLDFAAPPQTVVPPGAKIPESPVHIYLKKGQTSRFAVFFLDVKYDYDLVDFEDYKAWCLQKNKRIRRNAMHQVVLYNCYDENIPERFKNIDWNQVNYIINHKEGAKTAIQEAIWALADRANRPVHKEALKLLDEAARNGKDFRPSEGELLAIICYPEGKQPVFIEYLIPKTEVFDVAPAFFAPVLGGAAVPSLLPLGLLVLPAIPFIPDHPTPPPPPPPPPVPEPAVMLLLGSLLACMTAWRAISVHRKR